MYSKCSIPQRIKNTIKHTQICAVYEPEARSLHTNRYEQRQAFVTHCFTTISNIKHGRQFKLVTVAGSYRQGWDLPQNTYI